MTSRKLQVGERLARGAVAVGVERKREGGGGTGDERHALVAVLLTEDPRALPSAVDELVEVHLARVDYHASAPVQDGVHAIGQEVVGQSVPGQVGLGRGAAGAAAAAPMTVLDAAAGPWPDDLPHASPTASTTKVANGRPRTT